MTKAKLPKVRISARSFQLAFCLMLGLTVSFSVSAQYHSLCWRISGHDLRQPSYIYGTMHVSDKRVFNFSPKVMKAFEGAKAYAMELDPDKAMSPSVLTSMMMTDGKTIRQLIPDSDYRFVDSLIKQSTGFGLALFEKMEPILISALLEESSMGMSISDTTNMSDEMDLYFYKKAKKLKKKQIGIETVDEQIAALHSLSYEEQAKQLTETIADIKKSNGGDVDLLKYYIAQDLDSLLVFSDESQMPAKFYKALVTDRNIIMADRIDGFIQKQPTFVAVGALHLPGKEGVIALLRKKGYTVEEWK
ncbi:MAG: TraB family protein [Bacteroidetes bacterium]|nr:TraB family protein [Bacteroidota bacterium]